MIYLASTSPRRKKILRDHGIRFKVIKPDYVEKNLRNHSVLATVKKHALMKGLDVAKKIKNGTVVSADTVVYFEKRIIGKPKNFADAVRLLSLLQGKWHVVYTAVALVEVQEGHIRKKSVFCETTKVRLKEMDKKAILRYFRAVNPLDKAGAYAIQSHYSILSDLKGSFFNAMGLPWERLRHLLLGKEI